MTTQAENDRLTQIGPGTPMGNLLRRYWQVVGTEAELRQEPVQKVRILGEDLTLFRTEKGEYGLVEDRCPHRCMSLEFGIPEECGLRCAYHGWMFDTKGNCVEMPYEDLTQPDLRYKDKIKIKAYPCQTLGGLVWAYMGPSETMPLLPRWDVLVREDLDRAIEIYPLPCNWVQCMDNSADPVHFEFLHAKFGNYQEKKAGRPPAMNPARHVKIAFDTFKYGFYKRRLLEGEPETSDDWTVGHPVLFPQILAQGAAENPGFQIRVPLDDTHTHQIMYRTMKRKPGAAPLPIKVVRKRVLDDNGKLIANTIPIQDCIAWIGQGPVSDRTREHLATSDRGVALYHKMLFENCDRVEQGLDPMGVIRDRAENEPMIVIKRESETLRAFASKYDNNFGASQKEPAPAK
ncbi:MAG TPA: Rieske 2Fe-2S domain-containing protein [Stellaceae bacterium]|nr:Rieske 2Fe-2S domain-containing protein [Stellaceae bacterium]